MWYIVTQTCRLMNGITIAFCMPSSLHERGVADTLGMFVLFNVSQFKGVSSFWGILLDGFHCDFVITLQLCDARGAHTCTCMHECLSSHQTGYTLHGFVNTCYILRLPNAGRDVHENCHNICGIQFVL